jgi:geranylgeranyl diphosphate synthase, type II
VTTALGLDEVEAVLAGYARLTRTAMHRYLRGPAPDRYLYDMVRDYPTRSGKGLRPALLLATCEAFGGPAEEALGAAIAIELAHNDIEDASRQRRGRPTLHRLHGTPLALNAGDALAVLALRPLREGGPLSTRLQQRLFDEFLQMVTRTIEGQATELGWRADNVVDLLPSDYLELIGQKTCWYTTVWPLRAGALIGSSGTASLDNLTRFGYFLGAAFQIRDDLLNLVGSEEIYGKEIRGDIREGKRTLMLLHLLGRVHARERASIVDFLARAGGRRVPGARAGGLGAAEIYDLMVRHGSLEFAFEFGQGVATAAYRSFHEAFAEVPPSPARDFIEGLIPYMLARSV